MIRSVLAAVVLALAVPQGDDELIKLLPKSRHSLAEALQQLSKSAEVPISAKFEIEDGAFSLSVYTAGKGPAVCAARNLLQEYAGSPEAETWKPSVEVFKDVEHVARSAQQLTLTSLASVSLLDVVKKAEKAGTVYSIEPVLKDRRPQFTVLVAHAGKRVELAYDLSGEPIQATEPTPKK